jgi:hypothetical protein
VITLLGDDDAFPFASRPEIVHVPAVALAVYVTVTTPLALVVAEAALSVPQEAPVAVNITRSAGTTGVPIAVDLTVKVMTWVVAPSAAIEAVAGLATTVLLCAGTVVWAKVPLPLPPVAASVAVTVQKPIVVEAV